MRVNLVRRLPVLSYLPCICVSYLTFRQTDDRVGSSSLKDGYRGVWASLMDQTKEFTCNAGDPGLTLGSVNSPGEGNGDPLQYSCLENSMDRGAWWAIVHGVTQNRTRLSD